MLFELVGTPLRRLLARALLLGVLIVGLISIMAAPVHAAVGINKQLNFQGRLLNAQGATAPDGFYNVQFKIYQDGPGTAAGNPGGTLKWTEDWLNTAGNGVKVVNGYISVQLGSITPFGSSVDWNQDTLWLSLNIGNTNTTCTPFTACAGDGEMIPMKRLSAVPYALNAAQLGGLSAAGFVQNTTTVQTSTNMTIDGTARADTKVLTPLLDTNTATALNIGTTNATVINLNQNVTVAAGKSLTLAGGSTASRPASPTEGMMWYDTTTKQLLVYSNGKWQADRNTSTKIVAASNASQALKDGADYVATGTGDQTVINTALTAATGGKVYLTEGTYTINSSISVPNNTTLAGAGNGTVVTSGTGNMIVNSDQSGTGTGVVIRDMKLDGQTTGNYGIYIFAGSTGTNLSGGTVQNVQVTRTSSHSIYIGGANSTITGNTVSLSGQYGIQITASNSTVSNNKLVNNVAGVSLRNSATNNTVTGNTLTGNTTYGIAIVNGPTNNVVSNNTIQDSGDATANNGIYLSGSSGALNGNSITNNRITDTSATTSNYAVNIATSNVSSTYLSNNMFTSTPGTSIISDAGTGTVYANQARAENGAKLTNRTANDAQAFTVQNAAGTNALAVDTTTNAVLVASLLDTTTATTLSLGTTNATSITVGKAAIGTWMASSTVTVGTSGSNTSIMGAAQTTNGTAGNSMTIQGSNGLNGNGGAVTVQGGNANGTGTLGGNLTLAGGTGSTSNGTVILATSTFQTATNDAACFPGGSESTVATGTNCTIAQSSVNNNASVLVGFTNDGQIAFMPDPSIITAGRVVYVTASGATKDFTLRANSGAGLGIEQNIAMRKNTTATMIWNGADWTAAGASSSTTMQAAYDNTLQSAGGAELVVSKTSATNGLTIRDSTTNSVNGTLLSVQTSSAAGLFQVNSNVTEYATDAGAEVAGASPSTFPANTWSSVGSSTISRYTTAGNYIATGQGSVSVAATAVNDGLKNILTTTLTPNMHYNVSFTTRLASGTFTDMNVYYSVDGTANSVACATGQTSATSIWTKVNCTFTAPASGIVSGNAIIIRQATGVARTFYVDNVSVTIAADYNLATDGGVDDNVNFATNWSSVGGATTSWTNTAGNDASDSAQVVTTATAGQGVRNKLSINPLTNTLYRITAYAASSTAFTDFTIRYSRDGGSNFVACADYNTQTISTSTSSFTKVTCYVTTDATTATNPYVYFTQASGSARTFYVDTFSITLSSNSTPNVQIGGGVNGGPTTLFTLDRGASAPIASNNDALLGSMYYDTTLGKLQCYEADGWGACGSSPDNIITISPEYTNAVLHGTGIGTMTSDICSSYLQINDGSSGQPTICGSGETYNFYKWTSPQNSNQTYSIYVTYQLPSSFKSFNSGQTSLMARTDNGANGGASSVQYTIYRNSGAGMAPCGVSVPVSSGTVTSWQTKAASGSSDPSTCGFAPGNSIVFKIDMTTNRNANAYVGNLNFSFNNK